METITRFFRWLVWDWWHGESVSAYDTKRTTQSSAPAVETGNMRISRGLLYLVGAIVLLCLVLFLILSVGKVTLVSEAGLDKVVLGASGLTDVAECYARDMDGRIFIALDCFVAHAVSSFSVVSAFCSLILFALGFIFGYVYRAHKYG